jgi:hypothetical protein
MKPLVAALVLSLSAIPLLGCPGISSTPPRLAPTPNPLLDGPRTPPLAASSGMLVGQFADTSKEYRHEPIFLIAAARGAATAVPVMWSGDNFFSAELPAGDYRVAEILLPPRGVASAGAKFVKVPMEIPFRIDRQGVTNLGLVRVDSTANGYGVKIYDNSARTNAYFLGTRDRGRDLIPLNLGTASIELDRPIFDRTFPPTFIDLRDLPKLVDRNILAVLNLQKGLASQPYLGPCWRIPGYCYADDDTYSPRWNWQDQNAYSNYYNISLFPPWGADAHLGVDVTNYNHPTHLGWRLYTKRMSCADYTINCSSDQNTSNNVNDGPMPYFTLYNIHTGLLRTFIYINKANYSADQKLVANHGVVQQGNYAPDLDYASDLLSNALSLAISENQEDAEPIVHVTPALFQKWVIIDQELSYSPTKPIANGLMFSLNFDGIAQSSIDVAGDLQLERSLVLPSSKGGLQTVWNNRKKVTDAFNSTADWSLSTRQKGEDLQTSSSTWKQEVGAILVGTAAYASTASPYIGAALAGYQIFSSFMGGTAGGVQSELFEGAISLNGSLKHQHPIDIIKYGIHQSIHADPLNQSELAFPGRLGLWSLSALPSMDVYLDGLRMGPIDPRSLITVNPAANMGLSTVEASILIDFNEYVGCPNVPTRVTDIEKPLFSDENDADLTTQENLFWKLLCDRTKLQSTSANFMRKPLTGEVTFEVVDEGEVKSYSPSGYVLTPSDVPQLLTYVYQKNPSARVRAATYPAETIAVQVNWKPHMYWLWNEGGNGYNWDHGVEKEWIPSAREAYVKIYMLFIHRDDRTLRQEFIRTFKVNITRHACTLRSHATSEYDREPPPRCP